MEKKRFEVLLAHKRRRLLWSILNSTGMSAAETKEYLFSTQVYQMLTIQKSGVWEFSDDQLLAMIEEEKSGKEISW